MIRKIITIDENKCTGCGLCVSACHEAAIGLVDGKAKLLRDDYCDGLGNCLPVCPTGAITFEEREAAEYDEDAVKANMEEREAGHDSAAVDVGAGGGEGPAALPCGCPGTQSRTIEREAEGQGEAETESHSGHGKGDAKSEKHSGHGPGKTAAETHLAQWPVQIKLVPANAPCFKNADLLVAADCSAYAFGNFHSEYMKGRITIIGCPKLDDVDYAEKLTDILKTNDIKSVTITRMEVPCCGGIENAVKTALQNCGKMIPWQVVTISTDGTIL